LLRAQGGTNDALLAPASVDADFVFIDEGLVQVNMSLDEVGLEHYWRYGPAPYAIGHSAFQTQQTTFKGRALRPLHPVHLKGVNQSGDFLISWIRRGRIGADSWEIADIPIGEADERYELEILDNGSPIRLVSLDVPHYTYSEADQVVDWGAPQSTYEINVYQLSQIYGRGGRAGAILINQ